MQTQTLHRQPTHVGAKALVHGLLPRLRNVFIVDVPPSTPAPPHTEAYAHTFIYNITSPNKPLRLHRTQHHTQEKRLEGHEREFADQRRTRRCSSFEELKHGDAKIELIEAFPCASLAEAKARERHWLERTPQCVNKTIAGTHPQGLQREGAEHCAAASGANGNLRKAERATRAHNSSVRPARAAPRRSDLAASSRSLYCTLQTRGEWECERQRGASLREKSSVAADSNGKVRT